MQSAKYTEGQLHQFGKICFEDAVGKTIRLPAPVSPLFNPPKTFRINRVEFEKPLPFAGYAGRRPDVVLTDEKGRKLIVEIKSSNGKEEPYLQDMNAIRMSLVLELDVSRWRKQPSLRPDFLSESPLQSVIDQTTWLLCGPPKEMEWRPYALVLYECAGEDCSLCCKLRGGFLEAAKGHSLRLFYGSPMATLANLAEELGLEMDAARNEVYRRLSSLSTDCKEVSVVTPSPDGRRIATVADRNPERTFRERGWVLLRDGEELPKFRIRKMPDGFQPVVYEQGFKTEHGSVHPVLDFQTKRGNNLFVVRRTWKEAVKDLFNNLAPGADPITHLKNDPWKPATALTDMLPVGHHR